MSAGRVGKPSRRETPAAGSLSRPEASDPPRPSRRSALLAAGVAIVFFVWSLWLLFLAVFG
jgi:hypothetical protein